ncbi:OmpH family outer membrane protein [Candidatus Uabimicrobium sp. HlEnr_7]|uniref:OmpH family outer membrane protein n=1 Tax=Candidatus Uabimicrobium helgolandensis TaxID=3095367 RepID=UPI003557B95A
MKLLVLTLLSLVIVIAQQNQQDALQELRRAKKEIARLKIQNQLLKQNRFKIGFVNITKVFKKYTKAQQQISKIKTLYQEKTLKIKELIDRANEIKTRVLLRPRGRRIRQEQELAQVAYESKIQYEKAKHFLKLELFEVMKSVHRDISKVTNKYGKDNDFSAIFKRESVDFSKIDSFDQLQEKMASVLFWENSLDITDAIVELLNSNE